MSKEIAYAIYGHYLACVLCPALEPRLKLTFSVGLVVSISDCITRIVIAVQK